MKKTILLVMTLILSITLISCKKDVDYSKEYENDIYYTLFVRSFADSNGDGIGDLNGVTENLDYLQELGITAIWLLPIFKSPTYHGYDTTDYLSINPEYGTMDDFKNLINKATEKKIKIMLDLVINHTSDQHPWFIESSEGVNNEYRDYYVWKNNDAYQSFPGGLVDLNLDSAKVLTEIHKIIDYYMNLGVSGFRLDAVKHFYEEAGILLAESKNIIFMSQLNDYIKKKNKNAFVVGEVLENDFNVVSRYTRSKNSYFNFYVKSELEAKVSGGTGNYLLMSNLQRMYDSYREINSDFVDSPLLGNHDFDRVSSIYPDQDRLKQAVRILLSLPGSPFLYYGDELELKGVRSGDEGVLIEGVRYYDEFRRQSFIWGDDRTPTWLVSDGSNDDTKSYLEVKDDSNSMFNVYKDAIELRKSIPALMYGNTFVKYEDRQLQGYLRYIDDKNFKQAVLVVHNLSNKELDSNLDLKILNGSKTIQPFGTTIFEVPFSKIGDYK